MGDPRAAKQLIRYLADKEFTWAIHMVFKLRDEKSINQNILAGVDTGFRELELWLAIFKV